MQSILIGSPFGELDYLDHEIGRIGGDHFVVYEVSRDVIGFDSFGLRMRSGVYLRFDQIAATFLRYPYDLLPEFTARFSSREQIEGWKSIHLLAGRSAVNGARECWALRNRFYSLNLCRKAGFRVPEHRVFLGCGGVPESTLGDTILKALGNCFVSEGDLGGQLGEICTWMRDGADEAWVFEAQKHSMTAQGVLEEEVGVVYQTGMIRGQEFRCYSIGGEFIAYKRICPDRPAGGGGRMDRSSWPLEQAPEFGGDRLGGSLATLRSAMALDYFCFDLIVDQKGLPWVIDFNPLGSLPDPGKHPLPTTLLARFLLSRAR